MAPVDISTYNYAVVSCTVSVMHQSQFNHLWSTSCYAVICVRSKVVYCGDAITPDCEIAQH